MLFTAFEKLKDTGIMKVGFCRSNVDIIALISYTQILKSTIIVSDNSDNDENCLAAIAKRTVKARSKSLRNVQWERLLLSKC